MPGGREKKTGVFSAQPSSGRRSGDMCASREATTCTSHGRESVGHATPQGNGVVREMGSEMGEMGSGLILLGKAG